VQIEVTLTEVAEPPCYQKIASEAKHLNQLRMNANRIANCLGVDRTTVTRALCWVALVN